MIFKRVLTSFAVASGAVVAYGAVRLFQQATMWDVMTREVGTDTVSSPAAEPVTPAAVVVQEVAGGTAPSVLCGDGGGRRADGSPCGRKPGKGKSRCSVHPADV